MITVKVSRAFLRDREDRGLDVGLVHSWGGSKSRISLSQEALEDMIDDAAYQGWHTDASPSGIVRAARTAFRDLVKAGCVNTWLVRNNLAEPSDA